MTQFQHGFHRRYPALNPLAGRAEVATAPPVDEPKLSGAIFLTTSRISGHLYLVLFSIIIWPFIAPCLFGQTTKPVPSDGIQYVSANGSDSNDGLSWGTAKATLAGAVAVINDTRSGGRIYVASGNYSWSSTITLSKPVRLECAPGKATHIAYTGTTGAAIRIAWSPSGQYDGAGIYGCSFTGPGSTTGTSAIQIGDSTYPVSGPVIENVYIGVHNRPSSGFGTGIDMPTNAKEVQNVQMVNDTIMDCGTGIIAYGEENTIRGGSISENTTSVDLQTNNTEVVATGTSFDTDTGPYIVNRGIFTGDGVHFETNGVVLNSAGFIENEGHVTLIGGWMLLTRSVVGNGPFITTVHNRSAAYVQGIYVFGTVASAGSGSTGSPYLVTGPRTGGGLTGILGFYNNSLDSHVPPFDGTGAFELIVTPMRGRGHAIYFPSLSGTLALTGANGVSAGTIKMNDGRGSHIFEKPYSSVPVCVAADATRAAGVKVDSTAEVISVAGNESDTVKWICTPPAN